MRLWMALVAVKVIVWAAEGTSLAAGTDMVVEYSVEPPEVTCHLPSVANDTPAISPADCSKLRIYFLPIVSPPIVWRIGLAYVESASAARLLPPPGAAPGNAARVIQIPGVLL